jgi:hypothetical protein
MLREWDAECKIFGRYCLNILCLFSCDGPLPCRSEIFTLTEIDIRMIFASVVGIMSCFIH